jgi:hypothetical protein
VRGWNTTPSSAAPPGVRRDVVAENADAPDWMPNSRVISENSVLLPAPFRPSSTVKLAGAR